MDIKLWALEVFATKSDKYIIPISAHTFLIYQYVTPYSDNAENSYLKMLTNFSQKLVSIFMNTLSHVTEAKLRFCITLLGVTHLAT